MVDSEFEKTVYKKYLRLIRYFYFRFHWMLRDEIISQNDFTQAVWCRLIKNINFSKFESHQITKYIYLACRHEAKHSGNHSQIIRIPGYIYHKILLYNLYPDERKDAWKVLIHPRNRFGRNLTNTDDALDESLIEDKCYTYLYETLPVIMKHLTPKKQLILALRFGLNGLPKCTLEKTGKIFGYTREHIRQIEEASVRELRLYLLQDPQLTKKDQEKLRTLPHHSHGGNYIKSW